MRLRRVLWNPCKEYTRTGSPDTPSEASGQHIRVGIVPDCRHSHLDARRHLYSTVAIYTWMRADIWHPAAAICTRLLRTFHPDVHIRNAGAGWERRRFQLLRTDVSGSSDSVYMDGRAAILHSAAVFSWSFLIFATDILGYFALDICCLNPQNLLVTHQL